MNPSLNRTPCNFLTSHKQHVASSPSPSEPHEQSYRYGVVANLIGNIVLSYRVAAADDTGKPSIEEAIITPCRLINQPFKTKDYD